MKATAVSLLLAALAAAPQDPAKPLVLDVWPGKPPGETAELGPERFEETKPGQMDVKRLTNVSRPTIALYRPPKEKDTGAAVVVCPGGGYRILAIGHEGTDVAAWLNSFGVTAVLLKYRVPARPGDTDAKLPLQDAQRATSLVRSRAAEWGIDPSRIGMLGFSAGGHLTANAATNFDRRAYEPLDEVDRASCRPDFAVLVYSGRLLEKDDPTRLSAQIRVSKDAPPSFFVHAADDRVPAEGSIRMYQALRAAGVSAELHVYATGGHGFGMRKVDHPCASWPQRCEDWMRGRGLLNTAGK